MSTFTTASSVRAVNLSADDYPPCCGRTPEVITWTRGMGKGLISVICTNPECPNHAGVLESADAVRAKWDRFRNEMEVPA